MLAYEDLVVALTNWRTAQGLPTHAVQFSSPRLGTVDLDLPVAAIEEPAELDAAELEPIAYETADEMLEEVQPDFVEDADEPPTLYYMGEQTAYEVPEQATSLDYAEDTQYSEGTVQTLSAESYVEEESSPLAQVPQGNTEEVAMVSGEIEQTASELVEIADEVMEEQSIDLAAEVTEDSTLEVIEEVSEEVIEEAVEEVSEEAVEMVESSPQEEVGFEELEGESTMVGMGAKMVALAPDSDLIVPPVPTPTTESESE